MVAVLSGKLDGHWGPLVAVVGCSVVDRFRKMLYELGFSRETEPIVEYRWGVWWRGGGRKERERLILRNCLK